MGKVNWEDNDAVIEELREKMASAREDFRRVNKENNSKEQSFLSRKFGEEARKILFSQTELIAKGFSNRKI